MQLIEQVTVGSGGAASITFSAIPADYTDLCILFSGRSTGDNAFSTWRDVNVAFNGTTTGYSMRYLSGDGSSVGSDAPPGSSFIIGAAIPDSATTASTFGNCSIYIPNYGSSANKSVSFDNVTENNATQALQMITAGLWSNSAAITSVTLTASANLLAEFSSASLFGILAGSDGIVSVA